MRLFQSLVHVFFALLMLSSAAGKALDMPGFYGIVATYQLLPFWLIPLASWALTLLEFALGFALLFRQTWLMAAAMLLPLHVFYLLGLSQALLRGLTLTNCGCFGVYWARPLSAYSILEDICLLLLAVFLFVRLRSQYRRSDCLTVPDQTS
jgi:hypothetical protein